MKTTCSVALLAIALTFACRVSLAADNFPVLTTTDGKTYDHISVQRADPDGLYIEYTLPGNGVGSAKVKFTRLSAELQKQHAYDPAAAQQYATAQAQATLAWAAASQQQILAGQKARAEAAKCELREEAMINRRIHALADLRRADAELYRAALQNHQPVPFEFWNQSANALFPNTYAWR